MTENAADREALTVRLGLTRGLNSLTAANSLAGLWIFEDCVLVINLVLNGKVIRICRKPVTIEVGADDGVFHRDVFPSEMLRNCHSGISPPDIVKNGFEDGWMSACLCAYCTERGCL